jgi:uncharacterized protein YggT (Ycf19 family)
VVLFRMLVPSWAVGVVLFRVLVRVLMPWLMQHGWTGGARVLR